MVDPSEGLQSPAKTDDSDLGYAPRYSNAAEDDDSDQDNNAPLAYKLRYNSVYRLNVPETDSVAHNGENGLTDASTVTAETAAMEASPKQPHTAFAEREESSDDDDEPISRVIERTRNASLSARTAAEAAAALAARTVAISERISSGLHAESAEKALQLLEDDSTESTPISDMPLGADNDAEHSYRHQTPISVGTYGGASMLHPSEDPGPLPQLPLPAMQGTAETASTEPFRGDHTRCDQEAADTVSVALQAPTQQGSADGADTSSSDWRPVAGSPELQAPMTAAGVVTDAQTDLSPAAHPPNTLHAALPPAARQTQGPTAVGWAQHASEDDAMEAPAAVPTAAVGINEGTVGHVAQGAIAIPALAADSDATPQVLPGWYPTGVVPDSPAAGDPALHPGPPGAEAGAFPAGAADAFGEGASDALASHRADAFGSSGVDACTGSGKDAFPASNAEAFGGSSTGTARQLWAYPGPAETSSWQSFAEQPPFATDATQPGPDPTSARPAVEQQAWGQAVVPEAREQDQPWGQAVVPEAPEQDQPWGQAVVPEAPEQDQPWGQAEVSEAPEQNQPWGQAEVSEAPEQDQPWGQAVVSEAPEQDQPWGQAVVPEAPEQGPADAPAEASVRQQVAAGALAGTEQQSLSEAAGTQLLLDDYRIAAAAGLVSPELASLLGLVPPLEQSGGDDEQAAVEAVAEDEDEPPLEGDDGGRALEAGARLEGEDEQQLGPDVARGAGALLEQQGWNPHGTEAPAAAVLGGAGAGVHGALASNDSGEEVADLISGVGHAAGASGAAATVAALPAFRALAKQSLDRDPFDAADDTDDEGGFVVEPLSGAPSGQSGGGRGAVPPPREQAQEDLPLQLRMLAPEPGQELPLQLRMPLQEEEQRLPPYDAPQHRQEPMQLPPQVTTAAAAAPQQPQSESRGPSGTAVALAAGAGLAAAAGAALCVGAMAAAAVGQRAAAGAAAAVTPAGTPPRGPAPQGQAPVPVPVAAAGPQPPPPFSPSPSQRLQPPQGSPAGLLLPTSMRPSASPVLPPNARPPFMQLPQSPSHPTQQPQLGPPGAAAGPGLQPPGHGPRPPYPGGPLPPGAGALGVPAQHPGHGAAGGPPLPPGSPMGPPHPLQPGASLPPGAVRPPGSPGPGPGPQPPGMIPGRGPQPQMLPGQPHAQMMMGPPGAGGPWQGPGPAQGPGPGGPPPYFGPGGPRMGPGGGPAVRPGQLSGVPMGVPAVAAGLPQGPGAMQARPPAPGGPRAASGPPPPPTPPPPPSPYPGLLYTEGRDTLGRPVVVLNTAMLPAKAKKNDVLQYVLQQLQPVVQRDYVLVVLSLALGVKAGSLSSTWALGAYRSLAKPYRKNVKHIVLVQPSAWARALLALAQPFVSKKAAHKIKKVDNLVQVAEATGGEVKLESLGATFIREIQYGLGASPLAGLNGPPAPGPGPAGPAPGQRPPLPGGPGGGFQAQVPHPHPHPYPHGGPLPLQRPGTPPGATGGPRPWAPHPGGPQHQYQQQQQLQFQQQQQPLTMSTAPTPVYGPGGPGPATGPRVQGPPPPRPQFPPGPAAPSPGGMQDSQRGMGGFVGVAGPQPQGGRVPGVAGAPSGYLGPPHLARQGSAVRGPAQGP